MIAARESVLAVVRIRNGNLPVPRGPTSHPLRTPFGGEFCRFKAVPPPLDRRKKLFVGLAAELPVGNVTYAVSTLAVARAPSNN